MQAFQQVLHKGKQLLSLKEKVLQPQAFIFPYSDTSPMNKMRSDSKCPFTVFADSEGNHVGLYSGIGQFVYSSDLLA